MRVAEWNRGALVGVGLVAGAVQAAAGIAMYLAGVYFAPWSMGVAWAFFLVCLVVGTRWYTTHFLNNAITYPQAVLVGAVISVCTGVVYAGYNVITISYLYPNFLDEVVRARIAHQPTSWLRFIRGHAGASVGRRHRDPQSCAPLDLRDRPFPGDVVVPQKEAVTCSIVP